MLKYLIFFQSFVADRARTEDEGATAVEYGLLVALISAVIVVAVAAFGVKVNTAFEFINSKL